MGKIARQKTFVPDQRKAGGSYHTISGQIKKIDDYQKQVILMDKTRIDVDCILDIDNKSMKSPMSQKQILIQLMIAIPYFRWNT